MMNKKLILTILIIVLIGLPLFFLNNWMSKKSRENPRNATKLVLPNANSIEQKINKYRVSLSLPPYAHDAHLCNLAKIRADKLYVHDWMGAEKHFEWEKDAGSSMYRERYMSENVGAGLNEELTIEAWLKSKPHRETIESTFYTGTCVMTKESLVVQLFIR